VRQSFPISPYIFIITAEILGIAIRRSDDVKGFLWVYISTLECPSGISSDLFRFTFNPLIFENSFNIFSPISPYLFIITAEILGIAIRRSDESKALSTKMQNPNCPNMLMTLK
jgi:hypothetical protein